MPTSKKMLAKARDIEKKLEALNGPEWASDSSDDEAAAPTKPQVAPQQQKKPGRKQQKPKSEESRTIYIGHIPHGFYEKEMEGFFSQFGVVTNLRLSRSKRTGASKGYAFIEFGDAETAAIAAKTMDKYLMHGKQLVAHVVPPETASRPKLFKGADKPFLKRVGGKEQRERSEGPNPASLKKREQKKRQRLAEQFPGYDYPGYTNGEAPPAKRGAFQSPPAPASRKAAPKAKKVESAPPAKKAKKPDRGLFQSPPAPKTRKKAAKTPPVASPKTTPRSSLKEKLLAKRRRNSGK
jgi:nucleolar protein 15